jgi:hypothetical protein
METDKSVTEHEVVIQVLADALKEKTLLSVYADKADTESFWVGEICGLSEQYFLGKRYDQYGQYDGFSVFSIDEIYQINISGRYNSKLGTLIDIRGEKIPTPEINGGSLIDDLLEHAQKNSFLVTLQLFGSGFEDLMGFVEEKNSDSVIIRQINLYAEYEGTSTILIDSISEMECNTVEHRNLQMLCD